MAFDIKTGYNTEFATFVDFAQKAHDDGYTSAAAKATISSRTFTVTCVDPSRISRLARRTGDKLVNDATRASFKAAICEMFGGESKIPDAVKVAMRMGDYGSGKPLTSRRILAVKAAVDANAALLVAKTGAHPNAADTFQSPEVDAAARAMGFTEAELPKIARATRFYMQCENAPGSEMDAMREVATHGTKANLLAFCGGRFLESAENFSDGLRLIDSFRTWYGELQSYCKQHDGAKLDESADTVTKRNPTQDITGNEKHRKGLELLIFQDIAADPDFNLKLSGEDAFGYENSAAMRFYGRGMVADTLGRIFNVPPAKRRILFAATDAFMPVFQTLEEANLKKDNANLWKIGLPRFFVARVLNHLDELGELMAKGKLSTKNIVKMCFPDMDKPGKYDLKALNTWFQKIVESVEPREDDPEGGCFVQQRMEISGCTLAEAKKAYDDSVLPPDCAYHVGYSCYFGDLPLGGIALMRADMRRGYNYSTVDLETGEKLKDDFILQPDDVQQTVRFQDGEVLRLHAARQEEFDRNLGELERRLKDLCGEGHEFQMNIVGYCLSQGGNEPIKNTLRRFGVFASEHAVLDYSISKDDKTGAIDICYSSPAGLPISFSWTCRVNTDGTCSTTPLVVASVKSGEKD